MKLILKLVLRTTAAAVLAGTAVSTAAGQQPTPNAAEREARERALREAMDRDLRERRRALEMMEKTALPPPVERPQPRLNAAQVAEEFRRIQQAANVLHQAAAQSGALDLKLVARSAAEIKGRATRLGSGLALPKPEGDDKRPKPEAVADHEGLRQSLAVLHELVYQFVRSPVFTQVNVVDAEQSAKARRHLDEIIELSGLVKKGSEGLEKSAKKGRK